MDTFDGSAVSLSPHLKRSSCGSGFVWLSGKEGEETRLDLGHGLLLAEYLGTVPHLTEGQIVDLLSRCCQAVMSHPPGPQSHWSPLAMRICGDTVSLTSGCELARADREEEIRAFLRRALSGRAHDEGPFSPEFEEFLASWSGPASDSDDHDYADHLLAFLDACPDRVPLPRARMSIAKAIRGEADWGSAGSGTGSTLAAELRVSGRRRGTSAFDSLRLGSRRRVRRETWRTGTPVLLGAAGFLAAAALIGSVAFALGREQSAQPPVAEDPATAGAAEVGDEELRDTVDDMNARRAAALETGDSERLFALTVADSPARQADLKVDIGAFAGCSVALEVGELTVVGRAQDAVRIRATVSTEVVANDGVRERSTDTVEQVLHWDAGLWRVYETRLIEDV